jgi:GT2 family glycosyltransferase
VEQRYYANLAVTTAIERRKQNHLTKDLPLISVIVPTYNRPEMLKEAINSILAQSYQNFEIVVINDHSLNIEETISELNKGINKIVYIKHPHNRGLAGARNTGIMAARGKYIAYLDDDDIYYPDHLEILFHTLENGEYEVAYTDAYRAHQVYKNGVYEITNRDIPYSIDFSKDRLLYQNISPVNCFMHTKRCLDGIGLFDEDFYAHEDWEIWIRLSRKYDFKHIKKVTTEFRWRTDGSTMSSSRKREFLRTMEEIFKRYKSHTQGKPEVIQKQDKYLRQLKRQVDQREWSLKCSIIIPVYNQVKYTRTCLEALIENTPDSLYEVIIIDNASTDETKDFFATLEGDVKIITNRKNLGFAKACNQGAQAASGEYLVFLNNDTVPHKNWLTELIDVADAWRDVGIVGSRLLFPDNTIQHAGVAMLPVLSHMYPKMPSDFLPANKPRDLNVITAACMLIRRDIFFSVGCFHEGYTNGCEDIDLCLSVRDAGKRVFYNPRSVITHFEGQTPGREDRMDDNRKLLFERWRDKMPSDYEKYLLDDGFRKSRTDETKWDYHENLCKKTVSIIIVTYNSLNDIKRCLSSIQAETNLPYEVIIIDNNSADGTKDCLKGLKGFHVIINDENMGFAKACNQGILAANGEYIVLLNPDTEVTTDWAWKMMLHFRSGVGAVGPVSNYVAGLQKYELYMKSDLGKMDNNEVSKRFYEWNKNRSIETKLLIGFCMMIKRSVMDDIGLLDEDFFLGIEDLEYSWRLRQSGLKLIVATDVFIFHHGQKSFSTVLPEKNRRITQKCQDKLYSKLESFYGKGNVPSSQELWSMDWFRPSQITKPQLTSIVMLCFNQLEYTKKCLQSIVKYTSVPYELILVDNGSTDGTVAFLEDYANKHDNCKIILNNENRGFAGGNNQGIAAAEGDYILLLNNDVIVTQDWLERLIAHIESDENIGMAGPVSNSVSGPQQVEHVTYGQNMNKMQKFARNHSNKNVGRTQDILRLVGFCLLIKRQVLDIIGGLDENYGNGNYEDDDLCLRSRIAGFRNIIARDVFIHHYGSMTFKGNKIDYRDSLESNRRRFAEKWKDIIEVNGNEYRLCMKKEDQVKKLLEWGEERFSEGNFKPAIKIFERILKLDKINSQAMNNLGVIQWQISREPAPAMKTFQAALTLNPKDSDALENLVQAATESSRFDLINPALLATVKKAQPANPDLVAIINAQQNSVMTS